MDIRWLFFDAGYTLVDETAVWQRRFEEQALTEEAQSLGLTPELIRREVERSTRMRLPQYRTFLQTYGLKNSAPYRHELEVPYPDALPVLQALSRRYRLGVIANQSAGLKERLAQWGLLPFFSLVISSWDHQVMKPDRRLFEIALKEAACEGSEAVMIGDRLDNDILPAKALGMRTVWIRQGFAAVQQPLSCEDTPDWRIDCLRQLLTLF